MSKFVGVFSLLLMLWIFHGAKPALAETWFELKSENFIIYSDARDEQIIKIAEDLEYFRYFLQTLTIVEDTSSVIPLEIYGYKNSRKFHSELKVDYNILGFYTHNFHGTFAYGDFAKVLLGNLTGREILFHEYVHFFMRQFSSVKYPRWYDEGFADYLATFTYDEGTVKIGEAVYNRVYSLRNDRWVPFEEIIGSNNWGEVADDNNVSEATLYAQAWFLVHYLSSETERKQKLLKYLQALDNGKSFDAAFEEIFQMPIKAMGMELKDYWDGRQLPYTQYNFNNIQFKPKIKIRELSKEEGDFIKLKAISHRVPYEYDLKKFQKKVNKFIKKYPNSIKAKTLLAEKLLFQDDKEIEQLGEDIIREILKDKSDISQVNALMGVIQFYKSRDATNNEEKEKFILSSREYLTKAVELDTKNVFAQFYLGFVYLFHGAKQPLQGINAMGIALDLMPQHLSIQFHYALINARYGNLEEAMFFFKNTKKYEIGDKWNRVVDFCLAEIQTNGQNHQCSFANLDQFEED